MQNKILLLLSLFFIGCGSLKKQREINEINTFQRGVKSIKTDSISKVEFSLMQKFIKSNFKITADSADTKKGKLYGVNLVEEKNTTENLYKLIKEDSKPIEQIDILENQQSIKVDKKKFDFDNKGLYITIISVVIGVIVIVIGVGVFLSKK